MSDLLFLKHIWIVMTVTPVKKMHQNLNEMCEANRKEACSGNSGRWKVPL